MNKRNLIKIFGICFLSLAFSAFKLPSIGGGGESGGADWKSIAGDFKGAFGKINDGLILVLKGIHESNLAIDIKETSAQQLINEGEKLKSGSKMDISFAERSSKFIEESASKQAKKIETATLTAEEKAALAKAAKNYFSGAINAVPGYIQFFATFQKAQKAGTPKPMDLMGAAKDIPDIISNAPSMFEMVPTTFNAIKTYRKSLEAADIKLPDQAKGLDKEAAKMSF
jgi:hypothetical protein